MTDARPGNADAAPAAAIDEAPGGVGALVFGILGLVMLPIIGAIIALVLGYRARRRAREEPERYRDNLGRVGRILGWVGLLAFGGFLVFSLLVNLYLFATSAPPAL